MRLIHYLNKKIILIIFPIFLVRVILKAHITYPLKSLITQFWLNKNGDMNSSLPLLGDKQLPSFLFLRTSKTLSLGVFDECKTHLCFEFISHAILSILYSYSCKTHNISSKLGFV